VLAAPAQEEQVYPNSTDQPATGHDDDDHGRPSTGQLRDHLQRPSEYVLGLDAVPA